MTWKYFFTSSIGKKLIMGFTGFFLILFLVVHCALNSMIFFNDGGQTFNHWAHFMGNNLIIRTMEIGLFAFFLLHIVQGLMLWAQNNKARSVKYAINNPASNSAWYSRSMGLLGTLILFFLILHLYHFWVPSRFGGLESTSLDQYADQEAHNLYKEVQIIFSSLWVVIAYLLGVASLFWHLVHGFQSAFQTFGINHKRYTPMIKNIGIAYSVIVCLLFAAMPIAVYMKWVK